MIYLLFNKEINELSLYDTLDIKNTPRICHWKGIDVVSSDKDRGQICVHIIGKGIIAEFPISKTVLILQKPEV